MNFTFNLELFCVFLAILGGFVDQNERGFEAEGKRIHSIRETNGVSIIDIVDIVFAIVISRAVGEKFLHSN